MARFMILPDCPLVVRDTEKGANYHLGSQSDAVELYTLLTDLENIIKLHESILAISEARIARLLDINAEEETHG